MFKAIVTAGTVAIGLSFGLMTVRLIQLAYYWPPGADDFLSELGKALLMGYRFDLKVGAVVAFLFWPLLTGRRELTQRIITLWSSIFAFVSVTNFYYYGFYKTPIDNIIFGIFDDDTAAILHTIAVNFPMLQIAVFLFGAVIFFRFLALQSEQFVAHLFNRYRSNFLTLPFAFIALFIVLLTAKGTLKGMALEQDNLTVTSKPFLNYSTANGVIALFDAWDAYHKSLHITNETDGLRALGFESIQQVATALGLTDTDEQTLAHSLIAHGTNHLNHKNLIFFQMESWSAEPLRYQSSSIDVMGGLTKEIQLAQWFDNFDSSQAGTHPALEALLYGTPVTPITTGKYRDIGFDWSLPRVLKQNGYDTLFITSGQSGWRELNRVLITQGFDEVIDAATLRKRYPGAEGGIWGVWDSYMMHYIQERIAQQPPNRPLFIYAMTTTNHPPYELPTDFKSIPFDMTKWPGEQTSDSLVPNLQTYRYANDELAKLLATLRKASYFDNTIVAATGDHNVRTMGEFASSDRRVFRQQVPFMIWGTRAPACTKVLHQPASHLDIFPTLFPLLGVNDGYLKTGRNLFDCSNSSPTSLTFVSQVRTASQLWLLGQPKTHICLESSNDCDLPETQDVVMRARVALLDWNIRRAILLHAKQ
jgi:phosphoglycerol transferase MdoB-like AlkP superfamily enzyme